MRGLTYEDFLQTDAAINPGNSGDQLSVAVAAAELSNGLQMSVRSGDGMDRLVYVEKR